MYRKTCYVPNLFVPILLLRFSLIQKTKLHHLDPYRYYVEILKAISHCQTVENHEALLPWHIQLEIVGGYA